MVLSADVQPANRGDGESAPVLVADVQAQGCSIGTLYLDRGYLSSEAVQNLYEPGTEILCKA